MALTSYLLLFLWIDVRQSLMLENHEIAYRCTYQCLFKQQKQNPMRSFKSG